MSHVFIGLIAPSIILLPIGVAIYKYVQMPLPVRYIFYYLVTSGCINLIAIILSYHSINNLPLLHLLTLCELYFLLRFYAALFEHSISVIIKYVCAGTMLASLANSLWLQNIYTFNSYARGLVAISIIFLSLLYFIHVPESKKKPADICIVSGLLLYYAGSFFLFLFSNYLKKGYALSTVIWDVNASLVIVLYILIAIGILICNRRTIIFTSCSF